MYPYPTDTIEIQQIIENLESKSSSANDEISNLAVKSAVAVICVNLDFLINKLLSDRIFPSSMKITKELPLHKNGSKENVKKYRPISLLVVLSKIFERVAFNQIIRQRNPNQNQ